MSQGCTATSSIPLDRLQSWVLTSPRSLIGPLIAREPSIAARSAPHMVRSG